GAAGSEGSADLAAVRQLKWLSANTYPGWIGGDPARRCGAFCARGGSGRRQRHPSGLAAHDPCLADVEREARGGTRGAGPRRRVYPSMGALVAHLSEEMELAAHGVASRPCPYALTSKV